MLILIYPISTLGMERGSEDLSSVSCGLISDFDLCSYLETGVLAGAETIAHSFQQKIMLLSSERLGRAPSRLVVLFCLSVGCKALVQAPVLGLDLEGGIDSASSFCARLTVSAHGSHPYGQADCGIDKSDFVPTDSHSTSPAISSH